MEIRPLHSLSLKLPPPSPRLSAFRRQTLFRIRATDATDPNQSPPDSPAETQIHSTPPQPLEIRFRRGSRKRDATDPNQPPPDLLAETQIQSTPPEPVEIRFRRGSRKRRQLREEAIVGSATKQEFSTRMKSEPKKWDEMTVAEKTVELYMGEKGLLFWLNKFAYASIFIVIGGWILFRFVGPSLNLYQLDTSPLSPQSMFKG